MYSRLPLVSWLVLILFPPLLGQVVFSRRVYKEQGGTDQQIWSWNPADNSLRQLTDSPRWIFDRNTRSERMVGPAPFDDDRGPVFRKRLRRASRCGAARSLRESWRAHGFARREADGRLRVSPGPSPAGGDFPIESLAWSPSGKWLLVGTLGIDTNSSSPQSDLWVMEAASMKLTKAGSGNAEAWLPARDVFFYTSPRDLAPLGGSRRPLGVWVGHRMTFDPASGKTTAITSGVTNNLQPSICGK